MDRFKITLLFICLCCYASFSQTEDQRKLLADHQIKAKHTYRSVVENGRLTGDSILLHILEYNASGCPVLGVNFQPAFAHKSVYEYLNDTILLKMTTYRGGDTLAGEREYKYDSVGNLIQSQWHGLSPSDSVTKTNTSFTVYDRQNRPTKTYNDYGKGKMLSWIKEYDDKRDMVKTFFYYGRNKVRGINLIKYDARNNPTKAYSLHGSKKRLTEINTYNHLNQLTEKVIKPQRNYKMSASGNEYNIKKRDRIVRKYDYDEKGLLIRETEYINDLVAYRFFYKYVQ